MKENWSCKRDAWWFGHVEKMEKRHLVKNIARPDERFQIREESTNMMNGQYKEW